MRIVRKARIVQHVLAGASTTVLEAIVVGEPGRGDRELIQQGIVNLLQIGLAVVGVENSGGPDKRRGRIVRLQPNLLRDVLLRIVDGGRRAIVGGTGGQVQARAIQPRIGGRGRRKGGNRRGNPAQPPLGKVRDRQRDG